MLVLGHRGAPREARENTLDSFRAALAGGAQGCELDVRLTADGALAVRHDDGFPSGERLSGLTLAEARAHEPALPLLGEALDVLRPAITVVEMKSQGARNEAFCDTVSAVLDGRDQELLVSSFDASVLRAMRTRLPSLTTALLVGMAADEETMTRIVGEALDAGHSQLHVGRRLLLTEWSAAWFSYVLQVVAWTVNDPEEAASLRSRGAHAVITDVPREMAAHLA